MTKEEQRVAIAKACGWESQTLNKRVYWRNMAINGGELNQLPDYLNDLNAMHEAEESLSEKESFIYYNEIQSVQRAAWGCVSDAMYQAIHATAAQRAEAFLKTLKLWTYNKSLVTKPK